MEPVEKLKQAVQEWLVHHELDRDTAFYTADEWQARKERYLADSSLILVFEGALYCVLNGDHQNSIRLYGELEGLARRFGYDFELGHAWSMGFDPLPAKLHVWEPEAGLSLS
jgi:hypothetical protein